MDHVSRQTLGARDAQPLSGYSLEHLAVALADRYRLDHELGRGGMATVYLAEDVKHERKLALPMRLVAGAGE